MRRRTLQGLGYVALALLVALSASLGWFAVKLPDSWSWVYVVVGGVATVGLAIGLSDP